MHTSQIVSSMTHSHNPGNDVKSYTTQMIEKITTPYLTCNGCVPSSNHAIVYSVTKSTVAYTQSVCTYIPNTVTTTIDSFTSDSYGFTRPHTQHVHPRYLFDTIKMIPSPSHTTKENTNEYAAMRDSPIPSLDHPENFTNNYAV